MIAFASGLTAMGFAIAGLFFLRFWSRTRDIFFAFFAAAFWLFALNTGVVAILGINDDKTLAYLLRLLGFGLIIAAVFTKNVAGVRREKREYENRNAVPIRRARQKMRRR
jgi:uncharacterized protein DUF5985